jgi:predicted XRE-type DNA-binding protein
MAGQLAAQLAGLATGAKKSDTKRRMSWRNMSKKSANDRWGIEHEEGSGNVFADVGLPDADDRLARSKLGFHVHKLLADRQLTQREIGALLGIRQPEVSHLMNGHFSRFTTDKLLGFLKRLDRKVTIQISPHHPGEPYQEVGIGL